VSVHGGERDAEMTWIGLLQLWDVIRNGTSCIVRKAGMGVCKKVRERVGYAGGDRLAPR